MANNTFIPLDKGTGRPPRIDDSPNLVEDPSTSVRQRFLDEVIGKPPAGPAEKLQVIKEADEKKQPLNQKKSPAEIALSFDRRARFLLDQAHTSLQFTTDPYEPRVVSPLNAYRLGKDASATDIAKLKLGPSASDKQLELYANTLLKINKMEDGKPGDPIKADTVIKLPGQRTDGAITYKDKGVSVAEWYDGSVQRITERGKGSVEVKDKDGTTVQISWNAERPDETQETRNKDNKRREISADGTIVDRVKSDTEEKWFVSRLETKDAKGRDLVAEFEPPNNTPSKVTITDSDKNAFKLKFDGKNFVGEKVNAKGEVLEKDVRAVPGRGGLSIYWQSDNDLKGKTRTYEDGTQEVFKDDGELVERRGKDAWNRKVVEKYEEGEPLPYEISVAVSDKETVNFEKKPFGFYSAPYKDATGKEIGTIDLRRNGLLVYNNEVEQTSHAELPDGTKIHRKHMPDAKMEITETKDGNTLRRTVDRQGTVIDAEYQSVADGRNIYRKLSSDGESIEKVVITDKSKARTELAYDRDLGIFTGTRKDAEGKLLEKVYHFQGKLVYTDEKTGATRFERLNFLEKDLFGLKVSPGTYDNLTGTISSNAPDGSKVVESFAPGRTDVIKDGTVSGTTVIGEKSQILPTGEVVIHNPDDSGTRLNRDGSVDRWGTEDKQNAQEEPLTKAEGDYLRKHPDIDKRDLLAIHSQLYDDPAKLDSFYKALSTIDTAPNLSDAEKTALRKDIMHHVAFPAEIYQGNTWCCNVATVERDMAMNVPDKYATMLVQGLSEGKITLPNGTVVPVDKCNLKIADSTGRNFVSRAFQTMAIQAKYWPKYTFVNSEDGVGRLTPGTESAKPAAFVGLNMDDIAAVRHTLTGEKKAVVHITSPDELVAAWELNKGRSMTIAVNADEAPFSGNELGMLFGGQRESVPNHVVSITRIEAGPPPKAYVQNQWGLRNDMSTPEKAVELEVLLNSALGRVKDRTGRLVHTPAQVLSEGEPNKTYFFKDGQLVEERRRKK